MLLGAIDALLQRDKLKGEQASFDYDRLQIEHILPPRYEKDWARLHARNTRLFCGSCNRSKSDKPYGEWLDTQEGARLSNLESKDRPGIFVEPSADPRQFGFEF